MKYVNITETVRNRIKVILFNEIHDLTGMSPFFIRTRSEYHRMDDVLRGFWRTIEDRF